MTGHNGDLRPTVEKPRKLERTRVRARFTVSAHRLREQAEALYRERVAFGFDAIPEIPSADEARAIMRRRESEEKRKAKGLPEVWHFAFVYSEDDSFVYAEKD